MAIQLVPRRDENMEVILPADARATNAQPGLNWAWSIWQQVTAGVAYPFLLCGIYWYKLGFLPGGTTNVHLATVIQIGTGSGGSEVVIAEAQDSMFLTNPPPNTNFTMLVHADTWLFSPITVPASTRIALRTTQSHTSTIMRQRAYLFGYDLSNYSTPLWLPQHFPQIDRYLKGVSAAKPIATPILAPIAVTAGSGWAYGSWTQLVASLSRDTLITGLGICDTSIGQSDFQAHIGLGAASSEVAMSKVGLPAAQIGMPGPEGKALLPRPLFARAGERVSVRMAGFFAITTKVWLLGYEMN